MASAVASQANSEVARSFIEAHGDGDVYGFLSTLHPDVELETARGTFRGHEGARRWVTRSFETLLFQLQPESFFDCGDQVLGYVRIQFRRRKTGELAEDRAAAALFTFRDGKVVRFRAYEDRSKALDDVPAEARGCPKPDLLALRERHGVLRRSAERRARDARGAFLPERERPAGAA